MFRPFSLFVGLRYTRAKRRNHFISFIALTSMLGIALGVAVLITVLSVMNGFDEEIGEQVFGIVQHITVSAYDGKIEDWPRWNNQLGHLPGMLGSAPFVSGQTLLSRQGDVKPAFLMGVFPADEARISDLAKKMISGKLTDLKAGGYGLILGEDLANSMNVSVGDKVMVITPQVIVSPAGMMPQYRRFTVVGTFKIGGGFRFDNTLGFIHLADAQKLLGLGDAVTGIRLKIGNLFAAPRISHFVASKIPNRFYVSNWTQQFGAFFEAIKLEKNMMFLILLLIIAVAAFNLVSSLVMVVTDKQADIAILRTLGATPRHILHIFMVQGCLIGFTGTFLGVVGGILLAHNVTPIVNVIQKILQVQFISADVYFIDYLPSKLDWGDVTKITIVALVMSLLATIYPAWRAAKTQPAEALRYE